MDYKIVLYFILFNHFVAAHDDYNSDYSSYEDEYENTLSDEEFTKKENPVTTRPLSRYDVTEIVIDIPDNRTRGPIIVNHTIRRPLNLAQTTTPKLEQDNGNTSNKNTTKVTNKNDKDDKINKVTEESYNNFPFMPIIKEYLHEIKKGIYDGFNSIVNSNAKSIDGNHFHSYPGGPFSFVSKLQKQSSDAAHKFHSTLFGQKFDDIF